MNDLYYQVVAWFNNYFNIPEDMFIPAIIATIMIIGIIALILYEALSRFSENKGGVTAVSILVGIAASVYMLYNGWILALATFGVSALVAVVIIFFVVLILAGWHRGRSWWYKEKKEASVSRKEFLIAKKSEEEEAFKYIEKFWDAEAEASKALWTELKRIKNVNEKNANDVSEVLQRIKGIASKEKSTCERWNYYFKKNLGWRSPEAKYSDGLVDFWNYVNEKAAEAIDFIVERKFDKAENAINEMRGYAKRWTKKAGKMEEYEVKEERKEINQVRNLIEEAIKDLKGKYGAAVNLLNEIGKINGKLYFEKIKKIVKEIENQEPTPQNISKWKKELENILEELK